MMPSDMSPDLSRAAAVPSRLANSPDHFGGIAKMFHWATAIGILAMIPLGFVASNAPYDTADALATKAALFSAHKTIGVALFFLAVARIGWALSQPKPAPLHPDRKAETTLAGVVHWVLYGSLVAVPLSGWVHHAATDGFAPIQWPFGQSLPFVPKDVGLAEIAGGAHLVLQWVLIGALALHVAGALKHHVIDRDATLRRMLPGKALAKTSASEGLAREASHTTALDRLIAPAGALAVWVGAFAIAVGLGVFGHQPGATTAQETAQNTASTAPLAEVQSDWAVTEGTLGLSVRQFGQSVTGSFADWTADITYDPSQGNGKKGEVIVDIAIGSLTLGSVTKQALGADYLDAESHGTARYTAPILQTDDGLVANGILRLRGVEQAVSLPFTLDLDGETARMTGQAVIDRRVFGIGETMTDPAQLGFEVIVDVALTAQRSE